MVGREHSYVGELRNCSDSNGYGMRRVFCGEWVLVGHTLHHCLILHCSLNHRRGQVCRNTANGYDATGGKHNGDNGGYFVIIAVEGRVYGSATLLLKYTEKIHAQKAEGV